MNLKIEYTDVKSSEHFIAFIHEKKFYMNILLEIVGVLRSISFNFMNGIRKLGDISVCATPSLITVYDGNCLKDFTLSVKRKQTI